MISEKWSSSKIREEKRRIDQINQINCCKADALNSCGLDEAKNKLLKFLKDST